MKLHELSYFFECYNIPSLRYLYPTNLDLWNAFNKQEGKKIKVDILNEIEKVLKSEEDEQKQVMKYLNQIGIMGPIRFKKTTKMLSFLIEMKENITF
jgi:hypothetical protein